MLEPSGISLLSILTASAVSTVQLFQSTFEQPAVLFACLFCQGKKKEAFILYICNCHKFVLTDTAEQELVDFSPKK